ncbi:MAG: ComF family protein [Lachnospiraceae bacterium]|nr:ComF family protein [Lachnospiraceae bacterium]
MIACLFPPRCPVCGEVRIPWESSTCADCAGRLMFINEPVCMRCGRELSDETKEYCDRCEKSPMSYIRNCAVWRYDRWMKKSIADFKYSGKKEYAGFYIQNMAKRYGSQLLRYGVTVLVPVPVSVKRKRYRGFNQAELLAEGLAGELGIVSANLLKRVRHTQPQSGLSPAERKKNLSGAFAWNQRAADGLQNLPAAVAVVDDIFTTGSTMEACTKELQRNGIRNVYGICICIGSE